MDLENKDKLASFLVGKPADLNEKDLENLLYFVSEQYLWMDDIDSMSPEQAIMVWRVVESLRGRKLPDKLRL